MKVAVVGSSPHQINLGKYLPKGVEVLLTDDTPSGMESHVRAFSKEKHLKFVVFKADPEKNPKYPELCRNNLIVENADAVLIFYDGENHDTFYFEDKCLQLGKKYDFINLVPNKMYKREPG